MTDICLSNDEIAEITGKVRPSAQVTELRRLHIAAELRGNNTVLVYRAALPMRAAARKQSKELTPDFSMFAAQA